MKPYTEEMLLFLSEPDSMYYARLLLPEIADVLGVTVAQLESKPIDIQIILAQTYVNCWHSDTENVKEILEQDILLTTFGCAKWCIRFFVSLAGYGSVIFQKYIAFSILM